MGTRSAIDREVVRLAGAQHNVIATRQLLALGLSHRAIGIRARHGWLRQVHSGVYAVGHARLTDRGRWMAAVLACGDDAVLSHRSAAALWSIHRGGGAAIDITVPTYDGRGRRPGVRVHRSMTLSDSDRIALDGIPVTTPARTLLDLAAISPRSVARAVEEAERLRLFDLSLVESLLAEHRGRPGTRALADAIAAWREPELVRSELERRFLALCRRARLPKPRVNATLLGDEVDFWWPARRLVVETDGRETHGTPVAFERDRARDAELVAAGHRVVRFTYRQVRFEPESVAGVLQRLLV